MRAIYKAPGREPQRVEIENELGIFQQIVGGYIEPVTIDEGVVMLVDEEGKLKGREPNFFFGAIADLILGPVLIVGAQGDEFVSLPEDKANEIERILRGGFEI